MHSLDAVEVEAWDLPLLTLPDEQAVRDYLIGKGTDATMAADAAAEVEPPLTVTKRGAVVWGRVRAASRALGDWCRWRPSRFTRYKRGRCRSSRVRPRLVTSAAKPASRTARIRELCARRRVIVVPTHDAQGADRLANWRFTTIEAS